MIIINSYFFVNKKKSRSLKQIVKMLIFQLNFFWEAYLIKLSISNKFDKESEEISLKGKVYDFLVDCDVIDKSDILNIHNF